MAAASPSAAKSTSGLPPGLKGIFLLGSIFEVSKDWLGFYQHCADEYGDVVRVRFAHVPVYLVVHL